MQKSYGQKLKILYVARILMEKTDEYHSITTKDLIAELGKWDIQAERKSIYDDIAALQDFGMDIIVIREKPGGYYLASRQFELPELKLLVDAVQSAKFVTTKKTRELIGKLEHLTSKAEAKQLQRQVVVAERNKTQNENIYYNVDQLYNAMAAGVQISFQYFEWSLKKEMILRKDGAKYMVSPWLLMWEDENYYLIAFDAQAGIMKHYRVDKMIHIQLEQQQREGEQEAEKLDAAQFSKRTFGMFAGEEKTVVLKGLNNMAGVVLDRFGTGVSMRPLNQEYFQLRTNVAVSNQFFGWLAGLDGQIQILSPEEVKNKYVEYLKHLIDGYA